MATRVLEGVRLSELARCARQCALRGLNAEPRQPTEREQRWLSRGQLFGFYAYQQFRERYGDEVKREVEIPWPLGTGHADIHVPSENLIVEVVSSVSPAGIIAGKMKQARLYLHFNTVGAEQAAVYVIDPSSLDREDLYPVVLRDEDREGIEAEVAAVQAALNGGPLPDCAAATPDECRHSCFCAFTAQAWEDWQPPDPAISDDPELAEAVRELYEAKRQEQTAKAVADEKKSARHEAEQRLGLLGVEPGRDLLVAGLKVRRTLVKGRETFSLAAARSSGVWGPGHDEVFGPFLKVGAGSERWSVDRAGEETPDLEFGVEAPF